MDQVSKNLEGKVVDNSLQLRVHLATNETAIWFNGKDIQTGTDIWIAVPLGAKTRFASNMKTHADSTLPMGILYYMERPTGHSMLQSLQEGPLSPKVLISIAQQCIASEPEIPFTAADIWWDEHKNEVTYVGITPYSDLKSRRQKPLQVIGCTLWHMATGSQLQNASESLEDTVPQPFPTKLAELIMELAHKGSAPKLSSLSHLNKRLGSISVYISSDESDDSVPSRRQVTQEIWDSQQNTHVGRAAGQPVFFIVGGLVTAAVVSLLASLGILSNSNDIQNSTKNQEPVFQQQKGTTDDTVP